MGKKTISLGTVMKHKTGVYGVVIGSDSVYCPAMYGEIVGNWCLDSLDETWFVAGGEPSAYETREELLEELFALTEKINYIKGAIDYKDKVFTVVHKAIRYNNPESLIPLLPNGKVADEFEEC